MHTCIAIHTLHYTQYMHACVQSYTRNIHAYTRCITSQCMTYTTYTHDIDTCMHYITSHYITNSSKRYIHTCTLTHIHTSNYITHVHASHHITPNTSHHITSHYVTSHHITSHVITYNAYVNTCKHCMHMSITCITCIRTYMHTSHHVT